MSPALLNVGARAWSHQVRWWLDAVGSTRRQRLLALVAALCIIRYIAVTPTQVTGDAQEYLLTAQAWFDHGAPDLRPAEAPRVNALLSPHRIFIDAPYYGFYRARNGRWYCWHFWMYPLFAMPAKVLLHTLHGNEYQAFKWTNLALFLLACYVVLFHSGFATAKRWMLVALAAIGPVLWYVNWVHPECFSWSFTMLAIALVSRRNYPAAALCAGLAATQNPPLVFLTLYIVALSLCERKWRTSLASLAGATAALIPSVFYRWNFGSPNLIISEGLSSARYVSWVRFWSFFFDLNQGLWPYVPLLLCLSALAVFTAARRRQWLPPGIALVLVVMILSAAMTHDWISAMAGMQRYAVWMLPVFAWLIVESLPDTPALRVAVILAVAVHGGIVLSRGNASDPLSLQWPARLVWNHAANQYNPVFMIFAQRVTGSAHSPDLVPPIGYAAPDGTVTKILADTRSLADFPKHFRYVDTVWLRQVEREFGQVEGEFYLHPPPGAVRNRAIATEPRP